MKISKCIMTIMLSGIIISSAFATTAYAQEEQSIESEQTSISVYSNLNGWSMQEGNWYYYNQGEMQKSTWILYRGQYYYMNEDGIMLTDTWIGEYYVDHNGVWISKYRPAQWVRSGGKWWYRNIDGSYPVSRWQQIDNQWYYFDGAGYMVTGWQKIGGVWYYLDTNGAMLTGKREINGQTYYLGTNGKMRTGWSLEDSEWYYYNSSGCMMKGWQKIGGSWYYLHEDSGYMCVGNWEIDDKSYHFDSNGVMHTGWLKEINKWGDTGEDCIDWLYYDSNGAMHTGWLTLNGKRYLFSEWGYLACSHPERGETIIRREIDSNWYGFDSNGVMVTGWQYYKSKYDPNGYWMYFDKRTGKAQSGWIEENGKRYYIQPEVFFMLQNTRQYIDGKFYEFDSNGVAKEV